MLTAFLTTLGEMTRILMFMVLGFGLNRLHILPKGAGAGISRLITMVLIPALLIYNNMTEFQLANIGQYGQMVLLGLFLWAVMTLVSLPIAGKLAGGNPLDRFEKTIGTTMDEAVGVSAELYAFGAQRGLSPAMMHRVALCVEEIGFGVPFTACGEREINIIRKFVRYIRLSEFAESFSLPKDEYHIPIHGLYNDADIREKIKAFAESALPVSLFVMAGHSYEFEMLNHWGYIEDLLRYIKSFDFEIMTAMDFVKEFYP